MSARPQLDWTPAETLEDLLTLAITRVRSAEVAPSVLAQTIMVAIQTEVARAKEDWINSLATAMKAPKP